MDLIDLGLGGSKWQPKNRFPKVEDLKLLIDYAFTINPEVQYDEDIDRIKKVVRFMKKSLNYACLSYHLYLELSPTGRIHFHGYLKVSDPKEFYTIVVPKLCKISACEMDTIGQGVHHIIDASGEEFEVLDSDDIESNKEWYLKNFTIVTHQTHWFTYCTKQRYIWQTEIKKDFTVLIKTERIKTEIDKYYPPSDSI